MRTIARSSSHTFSASQKDGKGGCDRLCDFKASEFVTTTMKAAKGPDEAETEAETETD